MTMCLVLPKRRQISASSPSWKFVLSRMQKLISPFVMDDFRVPTEDKGRQIQLFLQVACREAQYLDIEDRRSFIDVLSSFTRDSVYWVRVVERWDFESEN